VSEFLLELAVPVAAIALSLWALGALMRRRFGREGDARTAALEEQVRGLLHRVWVLEQRSAAGGAAAFPPSPG
jgi:hypothetical protein